MEQKLSLSLSFKFGTNWKNQLDGRAPSSVIDSSYPGFSDDNSNISEDIFRVPGESGYSSTPRIAAENEPKVLNTVLSAIPPALNLPIGLSGTIVPAPHPLVLGGGGGGGPAGGRPRVPLPLKVNVGSQLDRGEWTSEGVWKRALPPGADKPPPPNLQQIKPDDLVKIRELGRGCFGSVWLARWRGVEVALKELLSQGGAVTDAPPADVFSEAERLAALRHPCILAFYGIVSAPGCCATVVEFMRMGSLKSALQRLRKEGVDVPPITRGTIALSVARGMEYLHSQSVVHFDLKCDNLLCDLRDLHRPAVKIGDLGLSKQKLESFISGNMRGTLPWMAPELFPSVRETAANAGHPINGGAGSGSGVDDRVNEKVDVFSYGIVLWEIWRLGEQPYGDIAVNEIFGGVMTGSLRPSVANGDFPPEWVALMEACWGGVPKRRPSFTEIAETLEALVDQWSIGGGELGRG